MEICVSIIAWRIRFSYFRITSLKDQNYLKLLIKLQLQDKSYTLRHIYPKHPHHSSKNKSSKYKRKTIHNQRIVFARKHRKRLVYFTNKQNVQSLRIIWNNWSAPFVKIEAHFLENQYHSNINNQLVHSWHQFKSITAAV